MLGPVGTCNVMLYVRIRNPTDEEAPSAIFTASGLS